MVKLVGDEFPYKNALIDQLNDAKIARIYGFSIYEFRVNSRSVISVSSSLLGEGIFQDLDGSPVIISLLQKAGLLWRLDINKLNSRSVMRCPDIDNIRCLGFGQGVSFED